MRRDTVLTLILGCALVVGAYGCGGDSEAGMSGDVAQINTSWSSQDRYMAERGKNRLYEGAPPVIPHAVAELGREDCLGCHLEGLAIDPESSRPSPITPHPDRINCRQCHVEQITTATFKRTKFQGLGPMDKPEPLHPLVPPYIPHRLQDRENCRTCHLSDTSPDVLTPAHGERSNCQQCHVQLQQAAAPFKPTHVVRGDDEEAR